jgi:hypothetical protein
VAFTNTISAMRWGLGLPSSAWPQNRGKDSATTPDVVVPKGSLRLVREQPFATPPPISSSTRPERYNAYQDGGFPAIDHFLSLTSPRGDQCRLSTTTTTSVVFLLQSHENAPTYTNFNLPADGHPNMQLISNLASTSPRPPASRPLVAAMI